MEGQDLAKQIIKETKESKGGKCEK
jgi:hypothetical protein